MVPEVNFCTILHVLGSTKEKKKQILFQSQLETACEDGETLVTAEDDAEVFDFFLVQKN